MKLIENFQQLLDADELPHRFSNWWIIEDADQIFDQHPFHPRGWQYPKLRHFFKNTKRDIGFYRKKIRQMNYVCRKSLSNNLTRNLLINCLVCLSIRAMNEMHVSTLKSSKVFIRQDSMVFKYEI